MSIEERLEALEHAHNVLGAWHEALMMVCKVMLPLINAPQVLKQRLLLSAYDVLTEHMQKTECNDDVQKVAYAAIDEISKVILN